MSKGHTTYRGTFIDIESLRNENEHTPAIGNMNVNAKGDVLGKGGKVVKTVDEIARENHRAVSATRHTSLKGTQPEALPEIKDTVAENNAPAQPTKSRKEKESANRDIIIEGDE